MHISQQRSRFAFSVSRAKKIPLNLCSEKTNWENTRWIPSTQQRGCACILLLHHILFPTDGSIQVCGLCWDQTDQRTYHLKRKGKTLGVPPHVNAGDKEHCGKQRDCRKEEGSGRVVFGNIYTWNISPVMEGNQRIRAHQHRRRIIMHYGHSFTLTQILQFYKFSRESRWEMKRNLLAGRLLKSPLGYTCSRWVWIKV